MTEPTDAELLAEWDRVSHIADAGQRRLACLRAVLAEWGNPAQKINQCGEVCERAKLCAICAGGLEDTTPSVGVEPIGYLYCGGSYGDELEDWEFVADQHQCDKLNEYYGALGKEVKLPTYITLQPTQAQAGAVPLDEARRLFDAGWKAATLFCDREDVVADGIIGFGACPQFEAAFSAAHGIKGGQHGAE